MMEYYIAVKRNEILVHITTRISDLGNIMLSEQVSKKEKCCVTILMLYLSIRIGKFIDRENRLEVTRG